MPGVGECAGPRTACRIAAAVVLIAAVALLAVEAAASDGMTAMRGGEKAALQPGMDRVKTGRFIGTDIVAVVGPWTITADDLLDSYEFGPSFVKRMKDPLFKHLEFMVYERLLAADALKRRRDTTAFVRDRLSALEEDSAVDQLYLDEVASKVTVTESEIDEAARKASVGVRVSWIVKRNQADAESLYSAYRRSETVDERLFGGKDAGAANTMETTLLDLERVNGEIARQIGRLHAYELSQPVKGPDGYYLFRVENLGATLLATETDAAAAREKAVRILRMIKADRLGSDYASRLMNQSAPVIKAEGFNILRAFLAEKGLARDKKIEWEIPTTFMTEAGRMPLSQAPFFLAKPLVTFSGTTITVGDYLQWFEIRQFQLKTSSLEAFNRSVKQTIWKMTQDRLLSREAYARGLQMRDTVRSETEKWKAKLLYIESRSSLPRQEQEKALVRTIVRLEREIPVRIDRQKVAHLQSITDIEHNPVEILYYKPRGTFPRVAFPTIDPAWQEY